MNGERRRGRQGSRHGRTVMHVVVRKYATTPDYPDQVRPKLAHLEETMRGLPGFVAYYFVESSVGQKERRHTMFRGHSADWCFPSDLHTKRIDKQLSTGTRWVMMS